MSFPSAPIATTATDLSTSDGWSVAHVHTADFERIAAHLCRLDEVDRRNRFGAARSDRQIDDFAHACLINRDILIVLRRGEQIGGVCHLSVFHDATDLPVAELGISVDAPLRRSGWATRMLQEALRVAHARHVTRLVIHYLRRNLPMSALARSLGDIEEDCDGDDVISSLPLVQVETSYGVIRRQVGPLEVFETMPAAPRGHVLFVHGAGGDARQWRQWVQPAVTEAGYRTTAVNLHNHDASARRADADAESYLADVEQVMPNGRHKPIVVGHSIGGYIAQRFAERHAVEHVVLVGSLPPTRLPPERLAAVRDGLRTRHARDVLERTMDSARPVATEQVRCRVTVVGSTHDKVVPMALVRDTALAYRVTPHELLNSGHSAMLGADWRQLASLCVK